MIAACVCECAQELCAVGIFLLTSLSSLVIACVYMRDAAKTLMQNSLRSPCALCNCDGSEHVCICAAIIDLSLRHDALLLLLCVHDALTPV